MTKPRPIAVEVRIVAGPDGRPGVLLQLEDGWIVVQPDAARMLAARLIETADELDGAPS